MCSSRNDGVLRRSAQSVQRWSGSVPPRIYFSTCRQQLLLTIPQFRVILQLPLAACVAARTIGLNPKTLMRLPSSGRRKRIGVDKLQWCPLLARLLACQCQSSPCACHVFQNGLHSGVGSTCRHFLAFSGIKSALLGSKHDLCPRINEISNPNDAALGFSGGEHSCHSVPLRHCGRILETGPSGIRLN